MKEKAFQEAVHAIEQAVREGVDELDLHGLGLKDLPLLPPELSSLRKLDLGNNRFHSIPTAVFGLHHLEELDLAANRIATVDGAIGRLPALRVLDLSENRLKTLPDELSGCTRLRRLNLFGNLIERLPEAVVSLPVLEWFDLARNNLEALPDLHGLAALLVLDLAGNRLSSLPEGLPCLEALRVLDLSSNRLSNLDISKLPPSLDVLYLDDNLLTENIELSGTVGRLTLFGNPVAFSGEGAVRSALPSKRPVLNDLVSGGSEGGKRYFEGPEMKFRFALDLSGKDAIDGSLEFYFKSFAGTPVSMRLPGGDQVSLERLNRKAALNLAGSSEKVVLEFPSSSSTQVVESSCEFASRLIDRIPQVSILDVFTGKPLGFTSAKPPMKTVSIGVEPSGAESFAKAIRIPVALPAAVRDASQDSRVEGAEPVDTAVFCPPVVKPGKTFMVQVFLYPPPLSESVETTAIEMDSSAARRGTFSFPDNLPRNTRVDFHLEMPSLVIDEPDAFLVWKGVPAATQFEVSVPKEAKHEDLICRLRIAVSGIPASKLLFKVSIDEEGSLQDKICELRVCRYRRAFVSYSSKDRAIVLRMVQAFKIAGLKVFQDILDLDPGERWEKALYREIDECDVFLLFWSHEAALSEWVQKEIAYAISRKQGDENRPPDIQPVPIEGPPIEQPPLLLKGIHFNDALLPHIQAAEREARLRAAEATSR